MAKRLSSAAPQSLHTLVYTGAQVLSSHDGGTECQKLSLEEQDNTH